MTETAPAFYLPEWPAPPNVRAAISLRTGGVSRGVYASNNLALHVEDDPAAVTANRNALQRRLGLAQPPQWLTQIHGVKVVKAAADDRVRTADACITAEPGLACAVLTADCLPILLCDRQGRQVAAVHAGWRSLAQGIVPRVVARFQAPAEELLAYLGPAISARHFEVGVEVPEAFFKYAADEQHAEAIAAALAPGSRPLHFYADLYRLARAALNASGVRAVYGGDTCTYSESEHFYSYRRDGATGRMASLIWRE